MLDHLRVQVVEMLSEAKQVSLTTGGIAGLQTSIFPCQSIGLVLYGWVPQASGHLVNIVGNPECVAVTDKWELRGQARRAAPSQMAGLALARKPESEWTVVIEIRPTCLQIVRPEGAGYSATIDIDESSLKGV